MHVLHLLLNLSLAFQANVNMDNHKLVLSVLCAALFPNVVQVVTPKTKYKASSAG